MHPPPSAVTSRTLRFVPLLALAGTILCLVSQWLIFVFAPVEASMGLVQKIFYLHLPLAWWGLFSFFVTFIASILYLRTGSRRWDDLALAAAETGLLLAVLAVLSGMLWAKPAWGQWWTWDARLTTTLVMCFVYAGYLLLRKMDLPDEKRARIAAVVGILAFLDVPLVFLSARLWSYIHPPSIGLEPEMKLAVVVAVLSFGPLWLAIMAVRANLAALEGRLKQIQAERLLGRSDECPAEIMTQRKRS